MKRRGAWLVASEVTRLKDGADPDCPMCHGEGMVSWRSSNEHGYVDVACDCVEDRDESHRDDD